MLCLLVGEDRWILSLHTAHLFDQWVEHLFGVSDTTALQFPLLFLSAGRNRTPLQKVSCLLTLEEFLILIISNNNIRDAYIQAKSPQSRLILCDPRDSTLPGSSVHGTLQAGILEWAAMPSSSRSSWPRDRTCVSYVSCIGRPVLDH